MISDVQVVVAADDQLGEGPYWHSDEQALYWVDIERQYVHRYHPGSAFHMHIAVDLPVTVLARYCSGDSFMAATRDGFAKLTWPSPTPQVIALVESDQPQKRFNDGAVDSAGRFWAGTMHDPYLGQTDGNLYRLDQAGNVTLMEGGFGILNGIGWSRDERMMYVTDSAAATIFAYDFDLAAGHMQRRRPFAHVPDGMGIPDGLALDSAGYLWSCCWDGSCLVRYTPQGQVAQIIPLPVKRPTSCTFGGPDYTDLYITSARTGLAASDLTNYPLSGSLLRIRTSVPGCPTNCFGR